MIKWDRAELARMKRAMKESLEETANDLKQDILNAQVIPKETGELERSLKVEAKDDTIEISHTAPHAARLYYHPEYKFDQSQNVNAKGMWLEDWIRGNKVQEAAKKYAKHTKEKF